MIPSNIILIGMPGSGKSTIGRMLAARTSRSFLDTDDRIRATTGRSLQHIVDQDGYLALRAIEERLIVGLRLSDHVIATGGSAVYSPTAMAHLRGHGAIVFLRTEIRTLRSRVRDYETRGLAKRRDQTIDDLFAERSALYRQYADVTVDCDGLGQEEVCKRIIEGLGSLRHRR
jgi:shikimate kinase